MSRSYLKVNDNDRNWHRRRQPDIIDEEVFLADYWLGGTDERDEVALHRLAEELVTKLKTIKGLLS